MGFLGGRRRAFPAARCTRGKGGMAIRAPGKAGLRGEGSMWRSEMRLSQDGRVWKTSQLLPLRPCRGGLGFRVLSCVCG